TLPPTLPPMHSPATDRLHSLIREVPDFPKKGISFKDFTPLLQDAAALAMAVELMANPFRGGADPGPGEPAPGVDIVVGAESRGFIFGTALAQALSAGFVPVRKPGKLPYRTRSVSYALEYGTDTIEIHADAIRPGQRVLLVDDLLATGGTLEACAKLVQELQGRIVGLTVLIELTALNGRARLNRYGRVHSVLTC
ncbi:MAG TPA: adenine phosphoribosyltransferase, partial [Phycisphaerales bacterium]|nr:adenine phosphoribosyltransferase [Phycisphaerales bacterium]